MPRAFDGGYKPAAVGPMSYLASCSLVHTATRAQPPAPHTSHPAGRPVPAACPGHAGSAARVAGSASFPLPRSRRARRRCYCCRPAAARAPHPPAAGDDAKQQLCASLPALYGQQRTGHWWHEPQQPQQQQPPQQQHRVQRQGC